MTYVVIFKARIKYLDTQYFQTAERMRDRALSIFNCQKFEALTEGENEIALSYWNDLADIHAWHNDAEHQAAQALGKKSWYQFFSVEVCEVIRHYQSSNQDIN